jgi:exodeoxyribonuclease III
MESSFVMIAKLFYNWAERVDMASKMLKAKFSDVIVSVLEHPEILMDLDKQRVVKRLLVLTITKISAEQFVPYWSSNLLIRKTKINSEILIEWLTEWSRKGNTADKQIWEKFIDRFVPSLTYVTSTTAQSCHVAWKETIERPEKKEVNTMVVWNGNGMRARWTGNSEFKELVRASDPDVLCFLEGKTDIEHLLQLEDFEKWITQSGFKHLYCYWSKKDSGASSYGNEGIILFSKVKCDKVTYGTGHPEMDTQARVMTAEFADCIMVFTYNPQGGFSEQSLKFREDWETEFGFYLDKVTIDAKSRNKKLVWAGDLNVNPYPDDWTDKAFERIKYRIPKNTQMAGCRDQDQKVHHEMVRRMNGVNLAEHFNKREKRTCFVTENCWRSNDGQRIDHIIVGKDLLDDAKRLRVTAFDVLQQFGGSKKGSSDHCPLWCRFERGEKAKYVNMVEEMSINEEFLEADILKRIDQLSKPPKPPDFDEMQMSDAFRDDDSYDDESDIEDICGIEEEDMKQRPYEDCPMPILKCEVQTPLEHVELKMLVDSGSALDLISGTAARKLKKKGCLLKAVTKTVRIKVANGKKNILKDAMTLQLRFGEETSEARDFLILEDLPFDLILGHETCKRWQGVIDWGRANFAITPGMSANRVEIDWNVYRGQHWRKPVLFVAKENTVIQPGQQKLINISYREEDFEGLSSRSGIVTPVRDISTLTNKFGVAYIYGQEMNKVIVMNLSKEEVIIKRGRKIAEFHPRSRSDFILLSTQETSCDSIGLDATVYKFQGSLGRHTLLSREANVQHGDTGYEVHSIGAPASMQEKSIDEKDSSFVDNGVHLPQSEKEDCRPISCAVQLETGVDETSPKKVAKKPEEKSNEGSNIQTQSNHDQVTDDIVAADWAKEPLSQIDLTALKQERSEEEVKKLMKVIWEYRDLLSDGKLDFGTDDNPKHSTVCKIITTVPDPQIQSTNRSMAPGDRELHKKQIEDRLKEGVIEPSCAPWSSNSLLVKKDGKVRMVIDYRALNKLTVRDAYPMPKIQDIMDCLKGSKWFTGIDCVQAFHQIPMADERSKDLTTFRGPSGGLFRYRYMPMGLVNAMAVWSRFIDTAMEKHQHQCVLCYADDCLIFTKSDSVDDHIADIRKVFEQLRKYGVKVKASKVLLGRKQMPFLGIIITQDGMIPNPDKVKAVSSLEAPKTLKQLRSTLGIFAYYRKFIPKFAKKAAPLYEQTKKFVQNKRDRAGKIELTEASIKAFKKLKEAITKEPIILHYPDWNQPFEIHTDASTKGIGAILCQQIDGKERVIMYASKTLSPIEKRYQIYEQECLAVVWAAELFRKYIRNTKTKVLTDCAALQWLKTRTDGARVMRWILRLQEFDLDIVHRKGKLSGNVDALTRDPVPEERPYGEDRIEELYPNADDEMVLPIKRLSSKKNPISERSESKVYSDEIDCKHNEEPEQTNKPFFNCDSDKEGSSREIWIKEQQIANSKQMISIRAEIDKPAKHGMLFKTQDDGLIIMKHTPEETGKVVVPESLRAYVLKMYHNAQLAAHQGKNRTLKQITVSFYWPGMKADITRWVKACLACRRRKTPRPMRAGIRSYALSGYPNQTIAIDIVGPFLQSIQGNMWILTIIDHFTRWPVAVPIPDRTSATIANVIFKYWICEKGVPYKIVSDQGRELVSQGIQQLCLKLGIMKVATSGYNPRGNAAVERFHRYLNAALCIIYEKKQPDWDDYIPPIVFSYRTSVNDTTGFSPFKLETGRDPILPVQTMFPFLHEDPKSEEEYVKKISDSLKFSFEQAQILQTAMAERNQERKPDNEYKPEFEPGDLLLVWEKASAESRLKGDIRRLQGDEGGVLPGKLRNPWQGPFKMLRWTGERTCMIERNGKEEEYNVNRLTKQYEWDAEHPDTSGLLIAQGQSKEPAQKKRKIEDRNTLKPKLEVGHMVIFPKELARGHRSPFGMGKILNIRQDGIVEFQWFGNYFYNANGIFQPGWKNLREDLGYYGRKISRLDVPWTGEHTEEPLAIDQIITSGSDLLGKDKKLTAKARKFIEASVRTEGRLTDQKQI